MKQKSSRTIGLYLATMFFFIGFTALRAQIKIAGKTSNYKPDSTKKQLRISAELLNLQSKSSAGLRKSAEMLPSNKYLQIKEGYVVVDITARDHTDSLVLDLAEIGMKNIAVFGRVISGRLPITVINALPSLKHLQFARPSYKPLTNAGAVNTQGDTAQRSHLARLTYGVTGKNIKIGVLSDSYNNLLGADATVLSGDLPGPGNPDGFNEPVDVIEDSPDGLDEGRAMLEIIHDVAPAAKLLFNTANGGQAAFANAITRLGELQSDLIVDDVIYFFEPYFQDGIIAQAVNNVAAKGTGYFSAAGNQERYSYESPFVSSGIEPFGPEAGVAHDFGKGDILQQITLPDSGSLLLILQWADPYYSAGGKGAETDIDIFLLNENGDSIVAYSAENNIGDDPSEGFYFENIGPEAKFNILIVKYGGPSPKVIKYIEYEGYLSIDEYNTKSSTIIGHPNAAGAIAVGAARYNRTPEYGINPPRIESFSSAGGTLILFDADGNPIIPIDRKKPDITAPNGGNTTFFYEGLDYEEDGWPNFFGTSAAAPHAAGAAALIAEASGSSNKKHLLKLFAQTSLDMDDPLTPNFDIGFDYASGNGLIQTDAAIAAALRGQDRVKYLFLIPTCSEHPNEERRWKIRNPNNYSLNVLATVYDSPEVKYVEALPGTSYFTTKALPGKLNFAVIYWKDETGKQQLIPGISLGDQCPSLATWREGEEDNDMSAQSEIMVETYPNPFIDKLKIQLYQTGSAHSKISLYNAQAELIFEYHWENGIAVQEFNLGYLQPGIYMLHTDNGITSHTQKIVKL